MYPYKPSRAQALEPHHEIDRKKFAKWLLKQNENFPQNVIWGIALLKHFFILLNYDLYTY